MVEIKVSRILEWVNEIETMNERLRKDIKDTTQEIEDLTENIRYEIRKRQEEDDES